MVKSLFIDSTNCSTELCVLGGNFNTDKSPFSKHSTCSQHRKGYTAVYSTLFSHLKDKNFNLAEIGIEVGASLKLWKSYFKGARICGFEFMEEKIEACKKMDTISDLEYYKLDITKRSSIIEAFDSADTLFDLIIEDTTHTIEDQNNCISTVHKYMNPGGILIIEDIYRNVDYSKYIIDESIWSFSTFITCHHAKRHCWDNDVILYLVKR